MSIFKKKELSSKINRSTRKKVGVAFGGGGLRGPAHVGVIKVLSEYNIPIDFVAGTSIGSAVASVLAAGLNWQQMDDIFANYDIESILRVRPSKMGFIPAHGYEDLIQTVTKGKNIEEMEIPLKIVAVDLNSHKKVVFDQGNTAQAVRASCAIPGIITPVKMDKMLLVDGGLLDACPGDVVREMGADIVIAINLLHADHSEPNNILEILERSINIATFCTQKIDADIILNPIQKNLPILKTKTIPQARNLGEQCAREHIEEIIELIGGNG